MGITSRQKRPIDRGKVDFRDSDLVIIATEGEVTEPKYFRMFRARRVQIEVLPTKHGASAPDAVLERLNKYSAQYELGDDDKLFLVIDTDNWPVRNLGNVAAECIRKDYQLIVSNPCFELWLYLHFSENIAGLDSCNSFGEAIRQMNGEYNKANLKDHLFTRERVIAATKCARSLDANRDDRWPQTTGTRVYRIIDSILSRCKLPNESD